MSRRVRRVIAALAALAVLLALAVHVIRLRLDESLYPKRGSFAWYVAVSATIRNMPTPGVIGEASYYTSAGDGTKPPQDEVVFRSKLTEDAIRQQVREYLATLGYAAAQPAGAPETYRNAAEQSAVEIVVKNSAAGSEVTITQYH